MRLILIIFLSSLIIVSPLGPAWAQQGVTNKPSVEPIEDYDYIKRRRFNIFTNTIIYGVFAGMAVGLAVSTDLEFDLNAELNLRHVARGASYGLYFGVIMGTWFAYTAENPANDGEDNYEEYYEEELYFEEEEITFQMTPQFSNGSPEGLSVHAKLVSF